MFFLGTIILTTIQNFNFKWGSEAGLFDLGAKYLECFVYCSCTNAPEFGSFNGSGL